MTSVAVAATPPGEPSDLGGIPPDVYARRHRILAVLCLSLVLMVAANSSLNVALPTLVRELGATQTQLQWVVDAYALVFAGLLLPAGAIGDRWGRKGALQFGLVVFAIMAVVAASADSAVFVIIARAGMGVGAAFVMPSTLSLLTSVFPPHERARAIAVWAGFAGAGGAIGILTSGLLLQRYWWGSVFFVNVPIVVLALVAGAMVVPTSKDRQQRPLDPVGAGLSMLGMGATLFGIIQGPESGWTSVGVLAGFVIGAAGLATFALWEQRVEHPMLELRWFRDRRFSIGASTIALAFFAMFGLFFMLTQYLQFVLDYSPLKAGAASLPMAVAMVIVAPRSAGLVEQYGPRRTVGTGLLVVAVGLLLASTIAVTTPYWQIALFLVLLGAGLGATTAPSTGQIMSAMPMDKAGVGSAVNDTTREVGGAVGVAVLGSIMTSLYRTNVADAIPDAAPDAAREVALSSIGAAMEVVRQAAAFIPADQAVAAVQTIKAAFTDAIGTAFLVAAAATLLNAAIVWRYAPTTASHAEIAGR